MAKKNITEVSASKVIERRDQTPAQVLIPQLSLHSMFWRPKYQNSSSWLIHVPVAFWLVEATQPQRLVELGTEDGASWLAFCQAVERLVPFSECIGYTAVAPDQDLLQRTEEQYQEFAVLEQATQAEALERTPQESIDLLHIAPGVGKYIEKQWSQWQTRLSPQAVVVISEAGQGQPGEKLFQRLKAQHPHFFFRQGNGLAIVAVGAQQSETLRRLVSIGAEQQRYRLIQQVFSRLGLACLANPERPSAQASKSLQLQAELERSREECQTAKQSLAMLEATQQAANRHQVELEERLKATQQERAELAQRNRVYQQEQQERFQELAKLTQLLQQAERERDSAREQAAEVPKLQAELERTREENQKTKQSLAGLEATQQAANIRQAELQQLLATTQKQCEELAQQNRAYQQEQQDRFKELAELTRMLEAKEKELQEYREQHQPRKFPLSLSGFSSSRSGKVNRKLKEEMELVNASGLFDEAWYLEQNADVKASGIPPLEHFLRFGGSEGRSPGPHFNTQWYFDAYPDVAESNMNPLLHYLKVGKQENRKTGSVVR